MPPPCHPGLGVGHDLRIGPRLFSLKEAKENGEEALRGKAGATR